MDPQGKKQQFLLKRHHWLKKKKNVFFRFALEPLLPKKMHSRSQDKLDKDDPDKEKKDKKKEKRNSKHQEIFDKEFKPTDIPLQQSEAVILSETVISQGALPHWLVAAAGSLSLLHILPRGLSIRFHWMGWE